MPRTFITTYTFLLIVSASVYTIYQSHAQATLHGTWFGSDNHYTDVVLITVTTDTYWQLGTFFWYSSPELGPLTGNHAYMYIYLQSQFGGGGGGGGGGARA